VQAAGQVAHLADRVAQLGRGLVDQRRGALRRRACLFESHRQCDESLLGPVVEVALDPSALLVRGLGEACPRGPDLLELDAHLRGQAGVLERQASG
jgi:hypothetical protein